MSIYSVQKGMPERRDLAFSQLIVSLFKLLQVCPGAMFPIWIAQEGGGMVGDEGGGILEEVFALPELAHTFIAAQQGLRCHQAHKQKHPRLDDGNLFQ